MVGAFVALLTGNSGSSQPAAESTAAVETTTPPSEQTPVAVPTHTKPTNPPAATTPPAEEPTTPTTMPPVASKHTDGYTYLFDIVGFNLGDAWKVVPDKVNPRDRVFVVEASCNDYAGHCRGIAVVNKVNAPVNIRLTDESTAIQLAGNTDPANRCYSDGGLHDNVWYQYPYNDGTTKFGNHALQHHIHKICGRDKGSDAAKERMHSWETDDVLVYDTDMANPGLGEDLLGVLAGARWL
jgi:hypothetical protein